MRRIILFVMALVVTYGGTVFANPFHETPNVWDNPNYKAVFAYSTSNPRNYDCYFLAGFVDISSIVTKDIVSSGGDKGKEYTAIAYGFSKDIDENGNLYNKQSQPILVTMREYSNDYEMYGEIVQKFGYDTSTGNYTNQKRTTLTHAVGNSICLDYYYIFHDFT